MVFWHMFSRTVKAKEIPEFTSFLVRNPIFRRMVLTFHNGKQNLVKDVDQYLESQLLTKEQYDAIYKAKRIEKAKSDDKNKTNRQ